MITENTVKINGVWYSAGSEIPVEKTEETPKIKATKTTKKSANK